MAHAGDGASLGPTRQDELVPARLAAVVVLVSSIVGSIVMADRASASAATRARPCASPSSVTLGGAAFRVPARKGEVWVLPLGAVPSHVGGDLKIVWRVTGRGALRVAFRDPAGRRRPLAFGPEEHVASSFHHRGREWGTGFAFDAPGCWSIRVQRVGSDATVRVPVTAGDHA